MATFTASDTTDKDGTLILADDIQLIGVKCAFMVVEELRSFARAHLASKAIEFVPYNSLFVFDLAELRTFLAPVFNIRPAMKKDSVRFQS